MDTDAEITESTGQELDPVSQGQKELSLGAAQVLTNIAQHIQLRKNTAISAEQSLEAALDELNQYSDIFKSVIPSMLEEGEDLPSFIQPMVEKGKEVEINVVNVPKIKNERNAAK